MLILACFVTSQASAIEVVTHPQVAVSSLTKSQLRRIYTMRQLRWSDNSAISVFVLPSQHKLHKRFAKEKLQIFPYQLNRIWHKLTYSGLGVAPTIVASEQELIQAIIKTPGAIGYIDDKTLIKIKQSEITINHRSIDVADMEENQQVSSKGVVNVVKIKD
jgi:ABC-type phosphate transport system substrate-binding protein